MFDEIVQCVMHGGQVVGVDELRKFFPVRSGSE